MSNKKELTLPPRYAFFATTLLIILIGFNHIEYMSNGSSLPYKPEPDLMPCFLEYIDIVLRINQFL